MIWYGDLYREKYILISFSNMKVDCGKMEQQIKSR